MNEYKPSALLDKLIAHAKIIGGVEDAKLTAERFVVAVMDAMDQTLRLEEGESIHKAAKIVRSQWVDIEKGKQFLLEYIANNTPGTYLDDLYMKKQFFAALELAKQGSGQEVTPEMVMCTVVKQPSDAILGSMRASAKSDEDTPTEQEAEFDQLFEEVEKASDVAVDPQIWARQRIAALTEKVKDIHAVLSSKIFGQEHAINVFTSGYFQAEFLALTDKERKRPRATFLFAGPPGVGKTYLAECAAEVLGLPFKRFDMSEYCDKEASIEFCGSDKVYKNGKSGNVTSFLSQHPNCVILFDEIEKAHISVIHLFLQILDAGRIRDNYTDEVLSLKDAILIFTTNAGKRLYESDDCGDYSSVSRKVILKALQKDINPINGMPYFPPAICSRFSSGNVVMFNHIASHDLRGIAKREVLRHAENFQREVGVNIEIDEAVYTALLFAEGGSADARTVRSRAETFFDTELFELFRLMGSVGGDIGNIEHIRIGVELPQESEIRTLFETDTKPEVLIFSSQQLSAQCAAGSPDCILVCADSAQQAEKILRKRDIRFVLLDVNHGLKGMEEGFLNVEDMESEARDFFHSIRQQDPQMPVYLLQTAQHVFDEEEKVSFLRQGVRGILALSENGNAFAAELNSICDRLHQQRSMSVLARSNRLVTFETAQCMSEDGKEAQIRLFDFKLRVAVDPEDADSLLSNVSRPNVSFDQVIGAEEAKRELRYFVEYLKNPRKYMDTGVRAPRGVLLYGPSGTGKTMLARAMANESEVTFITAEGNQFLKQYVGEGPEKVRELFRTARKYAPAILFVDEIDAIARQRGGEGTKGAEETLTAFLTEMDGFKNDASKPVFVLAATNYEVEPGHPRSLDQALMRRFDRRVYIDLPDKNDRIRYMKEKRNANHAFEVSDEKVENLAIRSTGMSLAELESVLELSLRSAIRDGSCKVTDTVLEDAFETFNNGEKMDWNVSQLRRVARHEAGHAFVCWHSGEAPSYVTVVARGKHGGYMQHGDNEGKAIFTHEELLSRIRTSLGGRAAEIVFYGSRDGVSTGAGNDLTAATAMAQRIVCTYGMDEEFGLGVVQETTQSGEVRRAVNRILSEEMKKAVELISANRAAVEELVEELLTRNHLTGPEISRIFEKNTIRDKEA